MPMYNLIEYISYFDTSGHLWNFKRDEIINNAIKQTSLVIQKIMEGKME